MKKNYFDLKKQCAVLLLSLTGASQLNSQVTQTFSYTGGVQTFTVPPCVSSVTFDVRGAQGGDAIGTTVGFGAGTMSLTGGNGGRVVATLTVTTGEVLSFFVGGKGTPTAGGFNGGGFPASCSGTEVLAGGGGGASDVRRTGVALTDRIIVAGGGGGVAGAGQVTYQSVGGSGGGLTGQAGSGGSGACLLGLGGTQSAGGAGGTNIGCSCNLTNVAGSGSLGNGGASICAPSGLSTCSSPCSGVGCTTGGGGGGGYYGGGAGVARASGGGGSSYVEPTATSVTHTQGFKTGDGEIIISYNFSGGIVNVVATPSAICSGGTSTLTTSGGVLSYTWSPGGSNASSITVSPTSNTTYTVSSTNAQGCISTSILTLTVNTAAPVLTVTSSTTTACPNNTVMLTASGALNYNWSNGIANGVAFTPATTNVYTVTGANGCGSSSAMIGVTVTPLPVTAAATSTLICAGTQATLSAGAATNYTWMPGAGTSSNYIVNPQASTVYTVTGTSGSCSGSATLAITTKPNPTIAIVPSSSTTCEGLPVVLTATGAVTYSWSPGGGAGPGITVTPTLSTLYTVTGTNNVNCSSSASQVVIVRPRPVITAAVSDDLVCEGGSSTLTASGASTYLWSNGAVTGATVVNPTLTTNYSVVGTSTANCRDSVVVTVHVFAPVIRVTSDTAICKGKSVLLNADGMDSYVWSTGSFFPSINVTPVNTTTYTVNGSSTQGVVTCGASGTIVVTVNPNPTVTAMATPSTGICRGESAVLNAGGATSYTWAVPAPNTGSGLTVTPTADQTYTLTGQDAEGCIGTGTVLLKVFTCVGIAGNTPAAYGLLIYPNPSNGEFTITSGQGIDLLITNELGQLVRTITLNTGSPKVTVSNLPAGVYFITGTNEHGSVKEKIIITK